MQPKFTLKKLGFVSIRIFALALIITASTQFSFAQQQSGKFSKGTPVHENLQNAFERNQTIQNAKPVLQDQKTQAKTGFSDNDAGLPNRVVAQLRNNPEALCTTFTYNITSADPTTSQRFFRDGVPKTCAAPGTCTAGLNGTFNYQIFQWVNPVAQCVTVTFSATTANFSFVSVHNAPPTLGNTCANWVADPGSSAAVGTPIVFSFNGTAGTTYYFFVTSVGAVPAAGTLDIDAAVCFSAPCSGTPAPGNTLATPNPVASGANFTLSVQNNPPFSGFVHHWQSSPTGSAPWTTIGTGPANTFVTSQTVATFYRDSVRCTTSSQFGISTPVQVNLLACGWSAATVSPVSILDQACVSVGSTLYSFAGVGGGAVIATSNKFDGTAWTPIAPTPQALEYAAACTDGTNIYILGGASSTGVSLTTLYRYNIATNTYTTLAPFSVGVWNPAAVHIAGKIYKFAGTGAAGSVNNLEIYDIATNTWTAGAAYPLAMSFVSAVAQGGFIYAGGGVQTVGTAASSKTYRYDPGTNTWDDAAIADLPATRWGAASAWYNNGFIMAGGYVGGSATANISTSAVQWNQVSNSWSTLANMTTATARVGGAATGIGGSFYVVGGRTVASSGFNGSTQNQKLFCIPPTPCSGAPAPGNTIASTNPVCSGVGFTLSLANNPFESGFAYQWQSGPSSTGPWTNLPGASTGITYSGSQTGATWYRCNVTCTPSAMTTASNPVLVADGQGIFTSHPASTSTVCGGNATFSFTATGASLTYGWEYRVTSASPWLNVVNGGVYSGATTTTLTLTNVPQSMSGYQYRSTMIGPCTAIDFSNVATLTVTPYIVNVSPPSASICTGTIQQLTITNTLSAPTTAVFSSGAINIPIPDASVAGMNHTIPVSGISGLITDISVRFSIPAHTWPGDIVVALRGPGGQILNLDYFISLTGRGPGAGFVNTNMSSNGTALLSSGSAPYTGTFRPDAQMTATVNGPIGPTGFQTPVVGTYGGLVNFANGTTANGNWTIAIYDGFGGDFGNLTNWQVSITYTAPVFAQGVWTASPAAPNTMFSNAAATTPYVAGTPATTIWVNPTVNTNYTVVVTTATPCISAPTVVPVSVSNPVNITTAPANRTVCVGSNATFSVVSGGGPLTYRWEVSVNNGLTWSTISSATTATLQLNAVTQLMNNNLYRVIVGAGPCGSVTSASARLNTNQLPTVTISAPDLALTPPQTTVITGTSTPAAAANGWTWTRDGAAISGTTNTQNVNINNIGSYQATATDINGCVNKSNILVIGSESSDRLWIYPNPTNGQFQVRLYYSSNVTERRRVTIYNALGQVITSRHFTLANNTAPYLRMDFDLTNMQAGTYVVKVAHEFTGKVVSGLVIVQ